MTSLQLLEQIKRLKAIADTGLLYASDAYDRERYSELQEMAYTLLADWGGTEKQNLKTGFPAATEYPTAKVDIRALVLSEKNEILLVKESSDGKWSLPGGWADIGRSPKETVVRECKEETGLDVTVKSLLAVFDKRLHAHPPQPFYVYKMIFHCVQTSFSINRGFDVLDVGYFEVAKLPELSENRILKKQIELVYQKILSGDLQAYFD